MDAFVVTTSVTNARLSARAERLYAFMQEKCDYITSIFMWRKAKTCEALSISEATYARAMRELLKKELVRAQLRYTEKGRQLVTYYYVVRTRYTFMAETEAVEVLSHSAFRVYMEVSRRCGKGSWAISRRSLADKLKVSMRTITRAVRELIDADMVKVTPENRLHICGNRGQTFNRFCLRHRLDRQLRRLRRKMLFLALLLTSPLDNSDTPTLYLPMDNSKGKRTKKSLLVKLKEIAGKLHDTLRRWQRLWKTILPDRCWLLDNSTKKEVNRPTPRLQFTS